MKDTSNIQFPTTPAAPKVLDFVRFSVFFFCRKITAKSLTFPCSFLFFSRYCKRQSDKQTADAPNVCNFPFTRTDEPLRILRLITVSASDKQSAKTTKPGASPGSITNLHCPSLFTRFWTVPETSPQPRRPQTATLISLTVHSCAFSAPF